MQFETPPPVKQHRRAADLVRELTDLGGDLLTQLEELPREILYNHRNRIQALLVKANTENSSGYDESYSMSACRANISDALEKRPFTTSDVASEKVLFNEELLMNILQFHGSFAPWHARYDYLVGWDSRFPRLHRLKTYGIGGSLSASHTHGELDKEDLCKIQEENEAWVQSAHGMTVSMLACRYWRSLNSSHQAWERFEKQAFHKRLAAAKRAIVDLDQSSESYLCALSVSNCVSAICEALNSWEASDDDIVAFEGLTGALFMCPEDLERRPREVRLEKQAMLAMCVLNAVCAGAVNVVTALCERSPQVYEAKLLQDKVHLLPPPPPYDEQIGGQTVRVVRGHGFLFAPTVLEKAVIYACEHSCLDGPVEGIKALLDAIPLEDRSMRVDLKQGLHSVAYRCNGSVLHVAAARGHTALVKVLLEAGLKPHTRDSWDRVHSEPYSASSEEYSVTFFCDNPHGTKGAYTVCPGGHTPLEYAQHRGHTDVVATLEESLSRVRPKFLDVQSSVVQVGILDFYHVTRDYGFLRPWGASASTKLVGNMRIYVHGDVLRQHADEHSQGGYPLPGHFLACRTTRTARGFKATDVASGHDGSYVELIPSLQEARDRWVNWRDFG